MSRVKREFYLPGARYSLNKDSIKAMFKKHGLAWKGSMEFPRWMNNDNTIIAEFLRENEVTVGAKLKFEGDPLGPFCLEFSKLIEGLGGEFDDKGEVSQQEVDSEIEKTIEEKMKMWDKVHRPQVELMRKGTIHNGFKPVPEGFINAALKDFKEKRDAEIVRIRNELMGTSVAPPVEEMEADVSDEEIQAPVRKQKKKQLIKESKDNLDSLLGNIVS